jgi:acyl dehydratase
VRTVKGVAELLDLVGSEVGMSGWELIDQGAIDRFAEATGDQYFIHVDPDRAKAEAGLDGTIAHGLLTLSLGPKFTYIELFHNTRRHSALGMLSPSGYENLHNRTGKPPDSRTATPFYRG